jgi:hypothetical protein
LNKVHPKIEQNPQAVTIRDDLTPPIPIQTTSNDDLWTFHLDPQAPVWVGEGPRCEALTMGGDQCVLCAGHPERAHAIVSSSV